VCRVTCVCVLCVLYERKDEWMNELTLNAESAAGGNNRVCHRFSARSGRWDFILILTPPTRSNYYQSKSRIIIIVVVDCSVRSLLYGYYCIGSTGEPINTRILWLSYNCLSSPHTNPTQGCFLCCHTTCTTRDRTNADRNRRWNGRNKEGKRERAEGRWWCMIVGVHERLQLLCAEHTSKSIVYITSIVLYTGEEWRKKEKRQRQFHLSLITVEHLYYVYGFVIQSSKPNDSSFSCLLLTNSPINMFSSSEMKD